MEEKYNPEMVRKLKELLDTPPAAVLPSFKNLMEYLESPIDVPPPPHEEKHE